jgi:SAM-dependent methyltransferase
VNTEYLRAVQYRDPSRLEARANLHRRYSSAPEPWYSWLVRQIGWPSPADVLEIGCGPGWMWAEAADSLPDGLRLTLTDLSPGMVEAARQRVGAVSRLTVATARAADAQALPFGDDSFDVAVANHMLYHVPDPSRALDELARVLRPGGVLLAAANGPDRLRQLWEVRAEVFGGTPTSPQTEAFGSVSGLPLVRTRFAHTSWRDYESTLSCTDADDVVAYLTSAPPGEDATPAQRDALHDAVARRMTAGAGVFTVTGQSGAFVCSAH